MKSLLETGLVDAVAICDPSAEMAEEARKLAKSAEVVPSCNALLQHGLDGVVIATPSALHAEQAIEALSRGIAVFCQKPLGRSKDEVAAVIAAARAADRLLDVDLSYRHTAGMRRIRDIIRAGELGSVFAADLVFHNAYGPDKGWFYDRSLSGGGCLMDLGVHLADLGLWTLDFPSVTKVEGRLFRQGLPLRKDETEVEDFAVGTIELAMGAVLRLACSWRLHAGCDAVISARFHGTEGGAALRNVNGSFYDFVAERYHGTRSETLCNPPDDWGGRAAVNWARQLAQGHGFDPACEKLFDVAAILDAIFGR
ncbi:Gfo/Idh/MocA family oxidoreductase [Rhizobium sp. P32RR-XVIII]|nr:Gfo/Idh/MocA family oxidoreductase [Rhizobium sp. P32RR-XVIII]